jgi:hypothetical protein
MHDVPGDHARPSVALEHGDVVTAVAGVSVEGDPQPVALDDPRSVRARQRRPGDDRVREAVTRVLVEDRGGAAAPDLATAHPCRVPAELRPPVRERHAFDVGAQHRAGRLRRPLGGRQPRDVGRALHGRAAPQRRQHDQQREHGGGRACGGEPERGQP